MSLPYYPFYPADFEADTSHLTLEEDGAYNRLLRLMWMTPGCSLPDDPQWLARRLRVDDATFERVVAPLLREFFKRRRGRIFSPRLTAEFAKTSATHFARVNAGKKGGRPSKSLKSNETDERRAKAGPKQPEPEPEPDKKEGGGGGGARELITDPTLRERILAACGADPVSGLTGPGGGVIGTRIDMQAVERWQSDLGLSEDRILAVIADAMSRKRDGPPSRLSYFDKPMQREAGSRTRTPLTPIAGGQDAQPRPYVDRRQAAADQAFADRILTAARARSS